MIRFALVVLLLGLLAIGCADHTTKTIDPSGYPLPAPWPSTAHVTTTGVLVLVPVWVTPAEREALLRAVTDTTPEADPRITPGVRGVPRGWTLHPGCMAGYYAPYAPSLLATGECRQAERYIYVAWRWDSRVGRRSLLTQPCLPALGHELRHAYTGDPQAGH